MFSVGTRVTSRPPHRSVRAQFGHRACMGLSLSSGNHTTDSKLPRQRLRSMKSKLQGSEPSIPKILQSQNRPVAEKRLSINGLAVVHG